MASYYVEPVYEPERQPVDENSKLVAYAVVRNPDGLEIERFPVRGLTYYSAAEAAANRRARELNRGAG